ncbi:MAG: hypothetical protein U0802_21240 [Candidatus Binatia bacterium]
MSGRPGPVVVDVPKDVQNETLSIDALPAPGSADAPPATCPETLARAAALAIDEACSRCC